VTRSMAYFILTALMLDHGHELKNLKQIIHVGGTTYGSVIPEHKTRFDYFLQNTVRTNLDKVGLIGFVDFIDDFDVRLKDHIDDFMTEAFRISNLEQLSFKNKSIQDRKHIKMPVPVVNVLFLPPTDELRVISDDPVRQNMAAYGPTEGSGKLVDIIAEGLMTTNLVWETKGHLAFRDLTQQEATQLYEAIFSTVLR